jgi:hypothetical protein
MGSDFCAVLLPLPLVCYKVLFKIVPAWGGGGGGSGGWGLDREGTGKGLSHPISLSLLP